MIRCLPAHYCPLFSCPHVTQRPGAIRTSQNRAMVMVVRAESTSASADVALSSPPPASKSIITPENILNALSGDGILLEDHYARLRVNPEASSSEIFSAYQARRAEMRQESLEETEAQEMLNKLQDSFDLLSSEEERRMYDWSLLRKATHTVDYAWPYEADITQRIPDSPPVSVQPEDDGGNRNVALFFAGWFVLSCILSIVVGMK